MGRKPTASLAPGFRFHPTDEELVRYYLRRKICKKGFRFDAIDVTDVYKSEPWELPGKSKLKSRDLEWYFFSRLDRKYSNGSKTNRATENGYWKTTGKDRPVLHKSKTVGMKKTLVYHQGRAPHGARSNWVMHEYRLIDEDLEKSGVLQDSFVLCRIFQKSGTGPKNGEQYGAPFEEEEWDDDEVTILPGNESADEVVLSCNPYPEADTFNIDAEEQADSDISPPAPPAFNYYEGSGIYLFDDDEKPFIGARESYKSNLTDGEPCFDVLDFLEPFEEENKPVKEEQLMESEENYVDATYLLDEPYFSASQEPVLNEGLFLETDFLNHVEPDPSNFDKLDEFLNYFESADTNSQCMLPENATLTETETQFVADESVVIPKQVEDGVNNPTWESQQLPLPVAKGNDGASSSHQCAEDAKFDSDYKHPFINMLGKKSTPYSFLTKDASLRLASSSQTPSSIHVTAGMVQIRNTDEFGNTLSWSFHKNGNIKVVLSLASPLRDANSTNLDTLAIMPSGKTLSAESRACAYLILFWVLIISVSFEVASLVSSK